MTFSRVCVEAMQPPTLQQFTKATGIKVDYKTVINDNDPFLAKIIPVLQNGQDTGYDLIVITNGGPVERMIKLGFLTPLDPSLLPNFQANAGEAVKNPTYDPGNQFSVAWHLEQSAGKVSCGTTGPRQMLPPKVVTYIRLSSDGSKARRWTFEKGRSSNACHVRPLSCESHRPAPGAPSVRVM